MCFRDIIASALFLLVKQYAHLVNNIHINVLVCILVRHSSYQRFSQKSDILSVSPISV